MGRPHYSPFKKLPAKFKGWTVTEYLSSGVYVCKCRCGNERVYPLSIFKRVRYPKSCGCTNWKTRKKLMSWRGYILEQAPKHPRANLAGYVLQHILVMEKKIGRRLLKGETVHHKNGLGDDNRPSNLELFSDNHGSGSRVKDKVKWAHEILKTYKPHLLKGEAHVEDSFQAGSGI